MYLYNICHIHELHSIRQTAQTFTDQLCALHQKKCSMNSSNDKIHVKSQAGNTAGNTYMQQVINVQKNLCHHFHIFCLAQSFNVLMPNINTHMHAHATARNCQFPSVPSAHHSHHPSPPHSFIPGLKLSFSANPSQRTLLFFFRTDSTLSLDCLLIVLSIHFFKFLLFLFFHFLVVGSMRLIKLTYVSFWVHIIIASRIMSCSMKTRVSHRLSNVTRSK